LPAIQQYLPHGGDIWAGHIDLRALASQNLQPKKINKNFGIICGSTQVTAGDRSSAYATPLAAPAHLGVPD